MNRTSPPAGAQQQQPGGGSPGMTQDQQQPGGGSPGAQGQRQRPATGDDRDRQQTQGREQGDQQQRGTVQDRQRDGQKPGGTAQDKPQGSGAKAQLSEQQRTKIRQSIVQGGRANRVDRVDFNISVGVVVPGSVRLVALPAPIVEIVPAYRGYLYFVVDDEIIIVEPGTLRIVAVIAA
jgi:hypothetical protein